jgi:PAS domain S-box-containing protein
MDAKNREQIVLESLNKCAQAFLKSLDFKTPAYAVYETCKKLIGATAGYVALLSSDEKENEILFLDAGGQPCDLDPDLPMPIRGLRAEAYKTGHIVYENDFTGSEWAQYLPEGHSRLENVLFAPLVIENKTVGIFGFANKPGGFNDDDILVVKAFAELAAVGLMQNKTLQKMKKSEKRLREIFNMLQGGAGVYKAIGEGEDFIILEFNRSYARQNSGKEFKNITGRTLLEVFPACKEYGLLDVFRRVWETGKPEYHPVTIYDGKDILSWRENYVYKLSSGEIVAIYQDITERKRMEKELLESENLFRSIFDTSPDPINLNRLDDGKFILINRRFHELTGYNKDEVIGKTALDISIWDDEKKRTEFFDQLLEEWEVNDFEAEFRRKDGNILTALVSAKLLPYKNSPHLLAVTRDITELKQAQEALVEAHEKLAKRYEDSAERLKETEIKYSALLEALLVGVYMCESDDIIFVNNQFAEMFGYSKDELLNMNLMDIIFPEDRENFNLVCGLPTPGDPAEGEFEVRGVKKNGDIIYLSGRNTHIKFNDKEGFLGNITDITRRKEAERELQRSEEDLRILSTQLLSAEERERKRIARDIHDSIGQAFSAIKFSIENSLLAIGEKSYITAQKALENMLPLTQQSIDEVRRIIMDLRPSTLDDLGLIATISWFSREFEAIYTDIQIKKEIDVEENDIPQSLKTVIFRILQEAFNNAAKYSGNDTILIKLRKHPGSLELLIEDKGAGFDVNVQQTKPPNQKGMGLTSMKERAQLSGGTFFLDSTPGKGTRIDIVWPLGENG